MAHQEKKYGLWSLLHLIPHRVVIGNGYGLAVREVDPWLDSRSQLLLSWPHFLYLCGPTRLPDAQCNQCKPPRMIRFGSVAVRNGVE